MRRCHAEPVKFLYHNRYADGLWQARRAAGWNPSSSPTAHRRIEDSRTCLRARPRCLPFHIFSSHRGPLDELRQNMLAADCLREVGTNHMPIASARDAPAGPAGRVTAQPKRNEEFCARRIRAPRYAPMATALVAIGSLIGVVRIVRTANGTGRYYFINSMNSPVKPEPCSVPLRRRPVGSIVPR